MTLQLIIDGSSHGPVTVRNGSVTTFMPPSLLGLATVMSPVGNGFVVGAVLADGAEKSTQADADVATVGPSASCCAATFDGTVDVIAVVAFCVAAMLVDV
jgi:hypothetical protein